MLCQRKCRIMYFQHSCSWQLFKIETKTKLDCIIRFSSYRAVNTASLVIKVRQLISYRKIFSVCPVIDKTHTNTFRGEKVEVLNRWPLKGLCLFVVVCFPSVTTRCGCLFTAR